MAVPVLGQFKDSLKSPCTGAGNERDSFLPWEMMVLEVVNTFLSLQGRRSRGAGRRHAPPAPNTPPVLCAAKDCWRELKSQIRKDTSAPEKRSSETGKNFSSSYG